MRDRGLMLLRAESFDPAAADLLAAATMNPDDGRTIDGLLRAAGPAGRLPDAERLLRGAMSANPARAQPAIGLSRLLASRGDFQAAADILRQVIDATELEAPLEQLASVYSDAGEPRLSRVVIGLRKVAPDSNAAAYFSAVLALMEGRPHEAVDRMRPLVDRGAAGARELTLLGSAYSALRRHAEARQAFVDAIRLVISRKPSSSMLRRRWHDKAWPTRWAANSCLDPRALASPACPGSGMRTVQRPH